MGVIIFTKEAMFDTGFKWWAEQAEGGGVLPVAGIAWAKGRKRRHKKHPENVVFLHLEGTTGAEVQSGEVGWTNIVCRDLQKTD